MRFIADDEIEATIRCAELLLNIFVARKLDDESDQLAKKPELRGRVRVQGRIERTDPSKRTIIMMGTRFIVAPNAQIRSVAKSAPEP